MADSQFDTKTTQSFAATLGTAVKVALTQGGAARQALLDARSALDAGDPDKAALIIRNWTAPGDEPLISIQKLIYESLPGEWTPEAGNMG